MRFIGDKLPARLRQRPAHSPGMAKNILGASTVGAALADLSDAYRHAVEMQEAKNAEDARRHARKITRAISLAMNRLVTIGASAEADWKALQKSVGPN
jgi:hypothetical protein